MAVDEHAHAAMREHVAATLAQNQCPHFLDTEQARRYCRLVQGAWVDRYRFATDQWKEVLRSARRPEDAALLPSCLWRGMPTQGYCEGAVGWDCKAPMCAKCSDVFDDTCPQCSWWEGLPDTSPRRPGNLFVS